MWDNLRAIQNQSGEDLDLAESPTGFIPIIFLFASALVDLDNRLRVFEGRELPRLKTQNHEDNSPGE
jgi:hypothetical protein